MKTVYQYILYAKEQQTWKGACLISARCKTLDWYCSIYEFILLNYPHRKRGYRIAVYKDPRFVQRFGRKLDDIYIHKVISEMEKECDFMP